MAQNTSSAVMQQRAETRDSLISRAEAKAIGQLWYFDGKPCRRGHVAKRNVSNCECRQCVNDKRFARRRENLEAAREKDRARHHRTKEARREQSRKSRQKFLEARREYDRARYADPDRKERQKAQALKWAKDNPGKRNSIIAARRSWVKQATPPWLTDEQKAAIRAFYIAARCLGRDIHVDHIIPLRGRNVCGLHVPWNLQLLSKHENISKGNRCEAET